MAIYFIWIKLKRNIELIYNTHIILIIIFFCDYTSLESINIFEHQYFRQNSLFGCDNLQRVPLPAHFYLHSQFVFYSPINTQEIIIWSKVGHVSSDVVFLTHYYLGYLQILISLKIKYRRKLTSNSGILWSFVTSL